MFGSPRQRYVLDVYYQPPGYSHPIVKEHHPIMAGSDAEGIKEAQAIFAARSAALVTGFAVRAIGSRRFGDQAVYRYDAAVDEAAVKHAAD